MTDADRIKLAGKLGLILATRVGSRAAYIVDDHPSPKTERPGWRMHYPKEPARLAPRT